MGDASTDPGQAQPYESLYRGPTDSPNRVHRTTARHYEPSSAPPGEQPPGDTYHWLYRNDEPATIDSPGELADLDAAAPPATSAPKTDDATRNHAELGPLQDPAVGGPTDPGHPRAAGATATHQVQSGSARRPWVVVALAVLLVALVVGAVLVVLSRQDPTAGTRSSVVPSGAGSPTVDGPGVPGSSTPSAPASAPETAAEQSGKPSSAVAPVPVSGVRASCQAQPSTDGGGRPVSYRPELAVDQDVSTAWRCDGSGRSESLTFSFATARRIAEVGLINGYAKVDPVTRADRYDEYRRITEVRWTFPSGASFTQDLEDGEESLQKLGIATQSTDRVQLTISRSTQPGSKARTRDAVLVSEVSFAGPTS